MNIDLSQVSTDDMWNVIKKRYPAALLAFVMKDHPDERSEFECWYEGGVTHAYGIAGRARLMIRRDMGMIYEDFDLDDDEDEEEDEEDEGDKPGRSR